MTSVSESHWFPCKQSVKRITDASILNDPFKRFLFSSTLQHPKGETLCSATIKLLTREGGFFVIEVRLCFPYFQHLNSVTVAVSLLGNWPLTVGCAEIMLVHQHEECQLIDMKQNCIIITYFPNCMLQSSILSCVCVCAIHWVQMKFRIVHKSLAEFSLVKSCVEDWILLLCFEKKKKKKRRGMLWAIAKVARNIN